MEYAQKIMCNGEVLETEENNMIGAAVTFFTLAVVAVFFGAYGIAGLSMEIGKLLVAIFLILAVISFFVSIFTGRHQKPL
mgnify:FL=1